MKVDLAFLGILLTLLMEQSSTSVHRNQDCVQMTDYGTCTGFRRMWAYSIYDHKCLTFAYSGCGGNTNRFRTRADCRRACLYA